jgi:hypothetical protein
MYRSVVFDLGVKGQLHDPVALPPRKESQELTVLEDGCVPDLI